MLGDGKSVVCKLPRGQNPLAPVTIITISLVRQLGNGLLLWMKHYWEMTLGVVLTATSTVQLTATANKLQSDVVAGHDSAATPPRCFPKTYGGRKSALEYNRYVAVFEQSNAGLKAVRELEEFRMQGATTRLCERILAIARRILEELRNSC